MFEQTFYQCPNCKTDIRRQIEGGDEFSCPSCASRFKVMVDEELGNTGLIEVLDREIPEPLFLPKGSIRALTTLILALASWITLCRGFDVASYHLNLLLAIIGYYFGFRMKMKSAESRIFDATYHREEPLFLPPGLIRFFLIGGFAVTGIVLLKNGLFTALPYLEFFVILTGLVAGYLFGKAFGSFRHSRSYIMFNHLKGAVVLVSAFVLSTAVLKGPDAGHHETYLALSAIVTFYFGSRSF